MPQNPILEVKTKDLHLFLQDGFFDGSASTPSIHSHAYTEIHMVIRGRIRLYAGETVYTLSAGDILAIPGKTYHYCEHRDPGTYTNAFQITKEIPAVKTARIPEHLGEAFLKEIQRAKDTNRFDAVAMYISLFCRDFFEGKAVAAIKSADASLIINEFFSNRYSQPVSVQSLAQELNLSEKQTARMVKKYTGNTFLQELTRRRIHAANYLIRSTDMTMGEIAESVGFRSYSGFWKAYKKQTLKMEASDRALPKEVE